MAVNLSPLGGVGAQFFDSNGNPLSGGLIYTYAAGTNTPAATYTSSSGLIQHSNPIVLDAGGRVPSGEIWLTDGISYKFVIQTSAAVLVGTYDNIVGINSNFIAYTAQQEIQTATAGQTVFTLTTMQYQPATNNLSVFVDGVNQYGPGAQYAYVETDATTVTFVSGLHVGASVKFTTASPVSSSSTDAANVSYTPPFTGSVGTNVQDKLAQTVSVKDFGAVGDGLTDDTAAIQAALDAAYKVYIPAGEYLVTDTVYLRSGNELYGDGAYSKIITGVTRSTSVFPILKIDGDVAFQYEIRIQDINIVGYNSIETPTPTVHNTGIHLSNSALVVLDNVRINDCYVGIDGYCVYSQLYNKVAMFNGYLGYRNYPTGPSALGSGCTSLQFVNCGISGFVAGMQLYQTTYSKFDGYIEDVSKSNPLCESTTTPICIRLDGNCVGLEIFCGFENTDAMYLYNTGAATICFGGYAAGTSQQFLADAVRIANVPFASQALFSVGSSTIIDFDNFAGEFYSAGFAVSSTNAIYATTNSIVNLLGGYFYVGGFNDRKYIFKAGAGKVNTYSSRFADTINNPALSLSTSDTTAEGTILWQNSLVSSSNICTVNTSNGRISPNVSGTYKITITFSVSPSDIDGTQNYLTVGLVNVGTSTTTQFKRMPLLGGTLTMYQALTAGSFYTLTWVKDTGNALTLENSSTNKPTLCVEFIAE